MEDLSLFIKGVISQLGRAFLLSGFLPFLIFVAINQYVIFGPDFSNASEAWNLFPAVTSPFLGLISAEWLTTIALAVALALLVLPLNPFITRLFEGYGRGMKTLLFPFYLRFRQQHRAAYTEIGEERKKRRELLTEYEESGEFDEDADFAIQEKLHTLHGAREKSKPVQALPYDFDRVMPTRFGNAWAVMEEYPLTRYGIDSMVFWPYVRVVLGQKNGALLAQIDNQKLLVDTALNLALAAGLLFLEGLVFAIARFQPAMAILAVVSLALFVLMYRAAVSYTKTMGILVNQGFDLYRLDLLDLFGLARPADLDDEYWVWTRLSAFLRRGEPFYFDLLERADEPAETDD